MFDAGTSVGAVTPYFLSRAAVGLTEDVPLATQPNIDQIVAQAMQTAGVLKQFFEGAAFSIPPVVGRGAVTRRDGNR